MAAGEIHLNDAGTDFRITLKTADGSGVDVSNVLRREFHFQRPDGSWFAVTATPYGDASGTDGILHYVARSGDLNQIGPWRYQAYISFADPDNMKYSDLGKFKVFPNVPLG